MDKVAGEHTPEGRLAVVAMAVVLAARSRQEDVSASHFAEAMRPFLRVEMILAHVDETRRALGILLTSRMEELQAELIVANRSIPINLQR